MSINVEKPRNELINLLNNFDEWAQVVQNATRTSFENHMNILSKSTKNIEKLTKTNQLLAEQVEESERNFHEIQSNEKMVMRELQDQKHVLKRITDQISLLTNNKLRLEDKVRSFPKTEPLKVDSLKEISSSLEKSTGLYIESNEESGTVKLTFKILNDIVYFEYNISGNRSLITSSIQVGANFLKTWPSDMKARRKFLCELREYARSHI